MVSSATYKRAFLGQSRHQRPGEGVHTTVVGGWLVDATVLREAAHPTGSILCSTLQHFGPCTQSHGVGQTEANDGPGKPAQPVTILVGCSRDDGKQCSHQIVMQFFRFAQGAPPTIHTIGRAQLFLFSNILILFSGRLKVSANQVGRFHSRAADRATPVFRASRARDSASRAYVPGVINANASATSSMATEV